MPIYHEPFPDPDGGNRQYKEPKALRQMRLKYTCARKIADFQETFKRPPTDDEELERFAYGYLRECYNNGRDTF